MSPSTNCGSRRLRVLALALAPLLAALPALPRILQALPIAVLSPLGRDQGIFQYSAWAITEGERLYRDIRDVNGPLTPLVHLAFLGLGGADEGRFRLLDLLVNGIVFAFVGACLPRLFEREGVRPARPSWLERGIFAFSGSAVLGAQYLSYLAWHSAQRESFFDWFMLPSVALQLVAQAWPEGMSDREAARRHRRLLPVVGALSVIPWFGKPTYAAFTFVQLVALFADQEMAIARRARFVWFGLGATSGAALLFAFLLRFGDVGAFLRISLHDVPAMYRFIWPRPLAELFTDHHGRLALFALMSMAAMTGLIAVGQMPRRALGIALLPLGGIANVLAQRKGFDYHYHALSAAAWLHALVFVAWVIERGRVSEERMRALPFLFAGLVGVFAAREARDSPHRWRLWLPEYLPKIGGRETETYFALFPEQDFFAWDMRRAAAWLRENTKPGDRVQTYGMDPYLLFLARRLSATPYIYVYDLSPNAALVGGPGTEPSEAEKLTIRHIRDAHERDMLERLEARPAAAFVFMDKAPLLTNPDAVLDFRGWCRESAAWFAAHYEEAARFGTFRIYVPKGQRVR